MQQKTIIHKKVLGEKGQIKHHYDAFPFSLKECTVAGEAAMHYGFTPVESLRPSEIDPISKKVCRSIKNKLPNEILNKPAFNLEEKATLLRMYRNKTFENFPHPTMIFYEKPMVRVRNSKYLYKHQQNLDIFGVNQSIAEALVIQSTFAILEEEGFENLKVTVNSIGDQESSEQHERELIEYIRTVMDKLPEKTREMCKKNPYTLFKSEEKGIEEIKEKAPLPISFLSEKSRIHFKEVLEYLEVLEIPYDIDHYLIGARSIQEHTVFSIKSTDEKTDTDSRTQTEVISAFGIRYNSLTKKLGYNKSSSAAGSYIIYQKDIRKKAKAPSKKALQPKFCFVHLGFEAKIKSLKVVELLRKEKIPMCHCLTKNKLAGQMTTADRLKLPYLLIMGQKEALEGTIMVRNIENRSQETVHLAHLPTYLKKISR